MEAKNSPETDLLYTYSSLDSHQNASLKPELNHMS